MSRAFFVTGLILIGPLLLWAAHRMYPEWFKGRLRLVQWIVAALIGFMLLVASIGLYLDKKSPRSGPAKPTAMTIIARSL